jgi:hypothetical protein
MIGDLSVLYAHHIHTFKLDLAVGRRNSEERALVAPVICFKGGYAVAISKLLVDFGAKVRKRLPHVRVKLAHARLVWSCSRLRRMIDKTICEEFLEYFEFPLALNFLCVSAHNCLRCIRN